jgi:chemotaxis protein CheX
MTETIDAQDLNLVSDGDIVAAIKASTQEVLSTMLNMEIDSADILAPQAVATAPAAGIISVIGLAGKWAGTGSIACSATFACLMSSKFLMTDFAAVDEEVLDAIAEITNMIIGNVKTIMEDKVGEMGLSTPTVIFGRNFQTRSARTHEWTGVRFKFGEHEMAVQLCLAPNPNNSQRTIRPGFQFPQVLSI